MTCFRPTSSTNDGVLSPAEAMLSMLLPETDEDGGVLDDDDL
jgi:hypothetical protein